MFGLRIKIISVLVLSKFPFRYFNIHIFSSKHKLQLSCKLIVEEDILIILEFIIGTNGVMVIVVENGHGDTSSNGRDWLHFT